MLRIILGAVFLLASASWSAVDAESEFVFDTSNLKSVETLRPGKFSATGNYLGGVKIARWADRFILTGYVSYGRNQYDVEANLAPNKAEGANVFSGEGFIKQYWKNGSKLCRYRFKAEVLAYENDKTQQVLYIRNYVPQSVYDKWDIDGQGCPPPGGEGYSWVTNPNPYFSSPSAPPAPKP